MSPSRFHNWPLYPWRPRAFVERWEITVRVADAADSRITRAILMPSARRKHPEVNLDLYEPDKEDVTLLREVLPRLNPRRVPWDTLRAKLVELGHQPAEITNYTVLDALSILRSLPRDPPASPQTLEEKALAALIAHPASAVDRSNAVGKGVAPRDDWFLKQYDAVDTDTYHSPATIRSEWNGMRIEDRRAICEGSPSNVSVSAVEKAISRAKKRKNGKMS